MAINNCTAPECDRPVWCKGYCTMHYQRAKKGLPLSRSFKTHGVCSVTDCQRPIWASGFCGKHYQRSRRPAVVRPTPVERIAQRLVRDDNGCLLYTGKLNNNGYGVISVEKRTRVVHRLWYEHSVGPIAEGLELDHLCRVTACCEPSHLEPVTHQENCRRGLRGRMRHA